jgi:hypothetical protein
VTEAYQNYSSEQFITVLSEQKNTITRLEERLAWFERQVFGKKSEKFISQIRTNTSRF